MATAWEGKVTKVINGNNLRVIDDNNEIKNVRLYGIKAPKDGIYNDKAINLIYEMVTSSGIFMMPYKRDKSQDIEVAAYTLNEDSCINEKLILHGLASIDKEQCRRPICNTWKLMEKQAKQKKLGKIGRAHV